jgi:high-affinity nickel-transport protein
MVSTGVSGLFLYLIGLLNLVAFVGVVRLYRRARAGAFDGTALEQVLDRRGLVNRLLGPLLRSVRHPAQMWLVGLLFGIGFDTATEVLLLAGTAAAATEGLPWFAVLTLPLLFSGGLMLCDSIDGFFMNFAYGWAFARPVRKVYYNITITALSVAVAFMIGGIEIVGLLTSELHLHGWLGDYLAGFDINTAGLVVVGLFVLIWSVALAVWRFGRIEARWEAAAAAARAERRGA